jgi:hypothetical protein
MKKFRARPIVKRNRWLAGRPCSTTTDLAGNRRGVAAFRITSRSDGDSPSIMGTLRSLHTLVVGEIALLARFTTMLSIYRTRGNGITGKSGRPWSFDFAKVYCLFALGAGYVPTSEIHDNRPFAFRAAVQELCNHHLLYFRYAHISNCPDSR